MKQFFEEVVDIYDATRGLPKGTMDEVVTILTRELEYCRRVLELGVGTGRFALPLLEKKIDVVGIDISKAMLVKACKKGCGNLVMGDVCTLPFKNMSFDAVISVHVLHLVSDCGKALREIKRVGKSKLISVVHSSSEFHVRDDYAAALARSGYTLKTPGIGEWGLKEITQPSKIIGIEPYDDVLPIGERLSLLEKRKHSFTKDPPDEVHYAAIEFLKKKYQDNLDDHAKNQIGIVLWDIGNLPDSLPRQ